jgi:hypothetical protein
MKNYGLIIGLCIGLVAVILAGVILFEGYQKTQAAQKQLQMQNTYQVPAYGSTPDSVTQSANERGTQAATTTESQTYMNDLEETQDDDGALELQSITTAAEGL